jgi:CheY-like chemotaxis protein
MGMVDRIARNASGWSVGPQESPEPGRVLVVDEENNRSGRHVEALKKLGLSCLIARSADEAINVIDREGDIESILVDATISARSGRPFVSEVRQRFGNRALRTVVVADKDTLDLAFDTLEQEPVELMCRPLTEADYRSVLGIESRRSGGVRETSSITAPRLAELSNEVGRIARALASLVEVGRDGSAALPNLQAPQALQTPAPAPVEEPAVSAAYVRGIIKARRARDQFFSSELFADPAWDILLDLMASRLEHKRVSVSSLCIAAAVPATTALRWIKSMSDEGMLVRRADPLDGRRVFIDLSDEAATAMEAYLSAMRKSPVG